MTTADEKQRTHKDWAREQVVKSIGQICDAWPDAVAASAARGYPSGGQGGSGGIGGHGDPTGNRAMIADAADGWLYRARTTLAFVARFGTNDACRIGPFNPPKMKAALQSAGDNLVDLWPARVTSLFGRLYELADEALREWPPRLEAGAVHDGVTVLRKGNEVDVCYECKLPVAGGVGDPKVVSAEGKPFHRTPCYNSWFVRQQRAAKRSGK